MNDAEKKPELQGKLREFLVMRNLYEAAARQLTLKFEILNDEFSVLYARNPIHHIESRVKTPESIAAKLMKKGMPVSIETAREHVNDIAGVRVVCSYIDDVYRVAEMLERQKDIEIVKRQDYIKTPNYNGYRSLHLDIRVPVYLSDRTEYVVAEIQIRTIAMDFWASLEHDIRYKADKSRLPEGINEEMLAVSGKIADIDRQMQDMYLRIRAAETLRMFKGLGEKMAVAGEGLGEVGLLHDGREKSDKTKAVIIAEGLCFILYSSAPSDSEFCFSDSKSECRL